MTYLAIVENRSLWTITRNAGEDNLGGREVGSHLRY